MAGRPSLPNEASIARLIGALAVALGPMAVRRLAFEQSDERATQHRCMQVEAFSKIDSGDVDPILSITTEAA